MAKGRIRSRMELREQYEAAEARERADREGRDDEQEEEVEEVEEPAEESEGEEAPPTKKPKKKAAPKEPSKRKKTTKQAPKRVVWVQEDHQAGAQARRLGGLRQLVQEGEELPLQPEERGGGGGRAAAPGEEDDVLRATLQGRHHRVKCEVRQRGERRRAPEGSSSPVNGTSPAS
jgi:hypothetical protein